MRIESEISRSGLFWIAGTEKKLSGILTIQDGGRIELELVGTFHDDFVDSPKISRILGEVEKDGDVTLDSCFYIHRNISFGGISKSRIFANTLYSGIHLEGNEPILITSFRFAIEGLDEWLRISGISATYTQEFDNVTLSYNKMDPLLYQVTDIMHLSINYSWSIPGSEFFKSATITHKNYFELETETPMEVSIFKKYAHQISTFVGLAVDLNVSICDVTIKSKFIEQEIAPGRSRQVPIRLYYQAANFLDKAPKIDDLNFLFLFPYIREDFALYVSEWFRAYETISPALNLYFSTKNNAQKYLDGKFLALAQGLETYHRRTTNIQIMPETEYESIKKELLNTCPKERREWLAGRLAHANEITLANRLRELISEFEPVFGDGEAINQFIRKVVDTRNYFTHYDDALIKRAVQGIDLWPLCQQMEAFFQMVLLRRIGFSKEKVIDLVRRSQRFQEKLKAK